MIKMEPPISVDNLDGINLKGILDRSNWISSESGSKIAVYGGDFDWMISFIAQRIKKEKVKI